MDWTLKEEAALYLDGICSFKNNWIKEGYIGIYNDENWKKLKKLIVDWYITKYPKDIIELYQNQYGSNQIVSKLLQNDPKKIESLSKYMNYSEFMHRIPEDLHYLVECWYNGRSYIANNKLIELITHKQNEEDKISLRIDRYDGSFYFESELTNIEEFINIMDHYAYNIKELLKLEKEHKIDLELRKLRFEFLTFSLLKSDENIVVGYIRAKKFIEEFNKYIYDLKIAMPYVFHIKEIKNIENFEEITDYILSKMENKNDVKNIDEFGLSFKAISLLKRYGIFETKDLCNKDISHLSYPIGLPHITISKRDSEILEVMKKITDEMYKKEPEVEVKSPKKKKFIWFKK